jgi:hypothetical protein
VFQLFASAQSVKDPATRELALSRYEKARTALKLRLVDASGSAIPVLSLHILDTGNTKRPDALDLEARFSAGAGQDP